MERFNKYKKEIYYGVFIVAVGAALFFTYQLIKNSGFLLSQIILFMSGFLDIISPVIYAFAIAYLLYYPVIYIQRGLLWIRQKVFKSKVQAIGPGLERILSIIIVLALVVLLIMTMIEFIVPPLTENIKKLILGLPELEEKILPWITQINQFVGNLQIDWKDYANDLTAFVQNTLMTGMQAILNSLTGVVGGISAFVVDFIVTIILTFYFLKDKEKIFKALNKFAMIIFPDRILRGIKTFIKDFDDVVGKFLVGTIFASGVVGLISSILMLLIGHPFAVLVGTVAGITNIIPYVGPLLGALLALILGSLKSFKLGLLGFILLIIYQQVDGNLIQPKIVGDKVGLAPVWILISVLIGGSYFGGIGMIIAVPIAALISVYIDRIYQKKIKG